jgi:hypothetical protein
MQLTDDQIQEIEQMAELFFSPEDIAENIEVDPQKFILKIQLKEGPAYKAFRKGWITSDMKLRKSIANAAYNGSSPAQGMLKQLQDKTKALIPNET